MQKQKAIVAGALATLILAITMTPASAQGYHYRGPGPVLGLLGAAVVGAATVATLPFAILAGAGEGLQPGGYYGPPAYGPPPSPSYYAPPLRYYAPPPPRYYGRPRRYYGY
jgi:hypothetical protein